MRNIPIASLGLIALFAGACFAQQPANSSMVRSDPTAPADPAKQARETDPAVLQLMQFGNADALKQRLKQGNNKGKTLEQLIAEDKADAAALVTSAKLQCSVTDAVLVAVDPAMHTKTYEVACADGPGYFLVQSDPAGKASGFTCFAANAAREADLAAGRQPGVGCALPENDGVKPTAAAILAKSGKTCTITELKWLGQSTTSDFVELACGEGPGFILRSPLPGSTAPLHIATCSESAANGLACRLPANDTTLVTLNAALAQRKISCPASVVHVIGHEAVKRRRVVEYFCPIQQPNGLVAFLPAEGSIAPFEALDCTAAAKRQVICTLTKTK